jgi:uncharacterized OsmC-like protein
VPLRVKAFEFEAAVDRLGAISAEQGEPVTLPDSLTPEHLVLAGLVRCSIASLRYQAKRSGADVLASGRARGSVTSRESDGRYAFVEIEAEFDVELEPLPDDLAALLRRTEQGCFVGASLTVKPVYRWRVNGSAV